MTDQPSGERIASLAGEGGGLYLYRFQKHGSVRFAWDTVWQIPDEDGSDPQKTPGWKAKEYATLIEAVNGAPGYWPFLAPVFVHPDIRDELWSLAADRLSNGGRSGEFVEDCLARWDRACGKSEAGR